MLAPILGIYASNFIAPLVIAVLLGLAVRGILRRRAFPPLDRGYLAVSIVLFVWSGLSLFWTVDQVKAVEKWAVVLVFVPVVLLALALLDSISEKERKVACRLAMVGGIAGIALIGLETATGGFFSRIVFPGEAFTVELFNRTPSVLLVFVWPAAAVLWSRSRVASLALLGAGLFMGIVLPSEAALASFAIGIAVFGLAQFWAGTLRWIIAAVLAVGVMASPLLSQTIAAPEDIREAYPHINPSLLHRLQIWDFTSRHIAQKPFAGWGFNAARAIPGGDVRYEVKDRDGNVIGQGDRLPLHPHNGALQVWLELGLPGALAFSILLAMVAIRTGAIADRTRRAMAFGMMSTMVPVWLFSFGVWQGWWLGALVLGALTMAVVAAETS